MAARTPGHRPPAAGAVVAAGAPRGWRESLRQATDLALLGFLVTVAVLPVLTAGAAVAAGSAATHRWAAEKDLPPWPELARTFARGLLPGLGATATAAVAGLLLVADLTAVASGRVPGGGVLLAVSVAAAVAVAGLAALTAVELGARGGTGWWRAAGAAVGRARRAPAVLPALGAVLAVAGFLAWLLPATTPVLVGFTLLAVHATARAAGGGRPRHS